MSEIKTRPATPEYRDNWEKIFGKRAKAIDDKTHRLPMTDAEYGYREHQNGIIGSASVSPAEAWLDSWFPFGGRK